MKWALVFFTIFILVIIVMADAGVLARYLGFLYLYPYGDKVGHFLLYGILAFLLNMSVFRSHPDRTRAWVAVRYGLILVVLIGLEEFSQRFFSNRTYDLVDLMLSYLGVICFSVLAAKCRSPHN